MSKYFYDCEFLEGTQKKKFWWGNTVPTIDLISIGIVSEDSREYYAISKDFNLKEAWNRYDLKEQTPYEKSHGFSGRKIYWIRENILKPIFEELSEKEQFESWAWGGDFSYKELKRLLKKYGKTNKQIAQDVFEFISQDEITIDKAKFYNKSYEDIQLYGYYSAYDHVALCWLFGKMIDLPTGFPMYTIDLKQELDNKERSLRNNDGYVEIISEPIFDDGTRMAATFSSIKELPYYPKQTNEHNSLSDAKFNFDLYKFLKR